MDIIDELLSQDGTVSVRVLIGSDEDGQVKFGFEGISKECIDNQIRKTIKLIPKANVVSIVAETLKMALVNINEARKCLGMNSPEERLQWIMEKAEWSKNRVKELEDTYENDEKEEAA